MTDSASKTEKPTPKRLLKARKEGNFLTSKEFVGAFQFAIFVVLLSTYLEAWCENLRAIAVVSFGQAFREDLGARYFIQLGSQSLVQTMQPFLIGALLIGSVTLLAQFITTGFGVSFKKLTPDFKRLNPISQIKELPRRNVPAAVQATAMLLVFGTAIYGTLSGGLDDLLLLSLQDVRRTVPIVLAMLGDLLWKAVWVFAFFGIVDLARQYRRRQKDLRMSKLEIRDEMKESDGDPQVKARLQRLRQEMLRNRMMQDVPTATAVIVNPTHFAVALKYDHGASATPMVVARGKNLVALRIRELARRSGVPLVENPPLAQALYRSVKVGQEIPPHLYRAVAEVLAYVYRMMRRSA